MAPDLQVFKKYTFPDVVDVQISKIEPFAGFDSHIDDTTTAQLIADSTEKKFNFNPFKGKLFKKKQYSFDFN